MSLEDFLDLPHPNSLSILRELLRFPEPLFSEDGSPSVLEDDPSIFEEVHHHTTLETHAHVVRSM